jgi:hypothetical protein
MKTEHWVKLLTESKPVQYLAMAFAAFLFLWGLKVLFDINKEDVKDAKKIIKEHV